MSWKAALTGAAAGFMSAVVVDLNAWSRSEGPFDWGLAARRWVAGAASGLAAALGVETVA